MTTDDDLTHYMRACSEWKARAEAAEGSGVAADAVVYLRAQLLAAEARERALRLALEEYRYCRHGCQECFCVKDARAALSSVKGEVHE